MSQMEPAYQNAGDVTETRTVRTAAMRKTARAPKGCVTPRLNSPVKTQVNGAGHQHMEVKHKQCINSSKYKGGAFRIFFKCFDTESICI